MTALHFRPDDRVLVLAPHPDDETLACGGLLRAAVRAGAAVRVVFLTRGEANTWPQRAAYRRWHIGAVIRGAWGERRRHEALAALGILGIGSGDAEFLDYPDQGLTAALLEGGLAERLAALNAQWKPTLLVTPALSDRHPDHNSAALAAVLALRLADAPIRHLTYVVHGRRPAGAMLELVLAPGEQAVKRRAIMAYASQMMLSRRRFMGYAGASEHYDDLSAGDTDMPHHAAGIELRPAGRGALQLHTRRRLLLGATVWVLLDGGRFLRITLPPWPNDRVRVEGSCNAAVNVRRVRAGRSLVLHLPPDAGTALWIKVYAAGHFLDATGWQRAAVPPAAAAENSRIACIIPCYNIAHLCGPVVREAARHAEWVLAVDDGSTDGTRAVLEAVAQAEPRVRVLAHEHNAGKGVALLTGFQYALSVLPFGVLVTLDGDAQHRPADIPRVAQALRESGAAMAIGTRVAFHTMPLRSRLGNEITGGVLRLLYAPCPRDTQSGFRAFTPGFAAQAAAGMRGQRYETELYILLSALEQPEGVATMPIPTVYLAGNRSSHFKPLQDSLRIFRALFTSWWQAMSDTRRAPGAK